MRGGTGVRCSAVKLWFSQSQQPQLRDAPMGSAFSTDGVWVQCESPGPYAGGDTVRGVVCVNLTKEKHFKDITLKARCSPASPLGSAAPSAKGHVPTCLITMGG